MFEARKFQPGRFSAPSGAGTGGGFAINPRFAAILPARDAAPDPVPADLADPAEEAFERGFTEGYATAREEAERQEKLRDAARAAITLELGRMDEAAAQEMAERLRQTVLALCEHAVMPLAMEPAGLAARVTKAVSMLQRAADERRVLIHPDDLALIHARLPADLLVEPDASVERGGLRIETPDGGVEDGPAQWRRILAEAFREC